jgi:ABC-type Fe3+-hydroxamate transport system substrate-binding protein
MPDVERGVLELGFLLAKAPEARRLVGNMRRAATRIETRLATESVVPVFVDTGFLITISDRSLAGDLVRRARGRNVAGANPSPEPFKPCEVVGLGARVVIVVRERGRQPPAADFGACPGGRRIRVAKISSELFLPGPNVAKALEAVAHALHPDAFR